ncbi:MAG: hypothetical protein U0Q11_09790 [Vicinamibacterales bacterium]
MIVTPPTLAFAAAAIALVSIAALYARALRRAGERLRNRSELLYSPSGGANV